MAFMTNNSSSIAHPKTAWIFDVDGVLTNPEAKQVLLTAIFDELSKRLQKGEPIILNTGRSVDFITRNILEPLSSRLSNQKYMEKLMTLAEKGAISITFDDSGKRIITIDHGMRISQELQDEIKAIVDQQPYSDTMFFDKTKQTMSSIELKAGKPILLFREYQKNLVKILQNLLKKNNLENTMRVDPTTICTDVENINVGKSLGVKKFLKMLEEKGVFPNEFICFGDSPSDLDMLKELKKQGKKTIFVFVGDKEQVKNQDEGSIIFSDLHSDMGTLSYLVNHD
jgi:hydroxymethylpyrimidine pyrophosphatase-like HAD family hydrolase